MSYLPLERVEAIANIFATFPQNPDRETVLTPWRAVNMHIGKHLVEQIFMIKNMKNTLKIDLNSSTRWIDKKEVTKNIFNIKSKNFKRNKLLNQVYIPKLYSW